MKKSLWGYNVQEVDESLDLLESAKTKLEKKVKTLTAELEAAREEVNMVRAGAAASGGKGELEARCQQAEKEAAVLRAEAEALRAEREELVRKNSQMAESLAAYEEQSMQNAVIQAGDICRAAYEDMANARANSKQALEHFLGSFWDRFRQYELQIRELYGDILNAHEASREGFLAAADDILAGYSSIRSQDEKMRQRLEEVETLRDETQKELEAVLEELSGQEEPPEENRNESGEEQEEKTGPKYKYAVLNELETFRKERRRAEKEAETAANQKTAAGQSRQVTTPFREQPAHGEREAFEGGQKKGEGGGSARIDVTLEVDKKNIV